jgi:hypothetical protein
MTGGWALVRERARLAETTLTAVAVGLALLGLAPLFEDLSWLAPALVMVAVIAALGAGSRAIGMPVPLVPVVEALGLLVVLTAMFVSSVSWGGLVPTEDSWRALGALIEQGVTDAAEYAAPAPVFPGLLLLAVGGAGLAAMATDTLFVSVRSPILAGVPLLSLYLAGALFPVAGGPWWLLIPPAVGWLLILAADQRETVRGWGRLPATARVRGLSTSGRRAGLVAVTGAVAVAVLWPPALTPAPWHTGQGEEVGLAAPAAGPVLLDPIVSLRRNLLNQGTTEVLRYRTDNPDPSYLRVAVLERFDGTSWRPRAGLESGRDDGLPLPGPAPRPEGVSPDADQYLYDITVSSLANAHLPLPYPVASISNGSGDDDGPQLSDAWRLDPTTGSAFSADSPATGLQYQVVAWEKPVRPDQLEQARSAEGSLWPLLSLPSGLSNRITRLAQEVTAQADTPYAQALLLQRWFTNDGGFQYSTQVASGNDADYLAEFLRDRIGYCEQFAAAMAVMARTLGIPSRVAVGFTQGTPDGDGTWRVTAGDAHAWPELWFDGIGWVRFEPTPRGGTSVQAPDYAPAIEAPSQVENQRGLTDLGGSGPIEVDPQAADGRGDALRRVGLLAGAVLLLAALVVLGRPAVTRRWRRRRRLADTATIAEGAWQEVGDLAVDFGQPWSISHTARQRAERLGRGMPSGPALALDRLRREVERARYARPGSVSGEQAEAIRADLKAVESELRRRVRWQTRVAGYCWPSSERRRQRSSMRSMKPGAEDLGGAGASAVGTASAGRAPKAE